VLLIEVTNAREVISQRIGRLGSRLIGKVVDAEAQVDSVEGGRLLGRSHLELPMQVRELRQVQPDGGSHSG